MQKIYLQSAAIKFQRNLVLASFSDIKSFKKSSINKKKTSY